MCVYIGSNCEPSGIILQLASYTFYTIFRCRSTDLEIHGVSETVVGVLGGGQLGRMLCEAASQLAIKVIILDPLQNCPASNLCHYHMVGSYDDSATVEEFAKRSVCRICFPFDVKRNFDVLI